MAESKTKTRIVALARTFPTLQTGPLEPWDADKLDAWASGAAGTSGSRHAAAFVLSVWNHGSQQPGRAATRFLCDWFNECFKAVFNKLYDLQELPETTPHQARALRVLDDHLRVVARSYETGERAQALELFQPLISQTVHADSLLSKLAPDMRRLERVLAPQTVEVTDVLKKLHEGCWWRVGPFIAGDALGVWDREHRAAFLAWAKDPWWA